MRYRSVAAVALIGVVLSAPAMAEDLEFLLSNNSNDDIVGFYVSQGTSNSWEENLLEGGYLAPGYEIDVLIADGATTCVYDIRTEFAGGDSFEDYDLNLCDLGGYSFD